MSMGIKIAGVHTNFTTYVCMHMRCVYCQLLPASHTFVFCYQVVSKISTDEWKAGKCFTGVGATTSAECMLFVIKSACNTHV